MTKSIFAAVAGLLLASMSICSANHHLLFLSYNAHGRFSASTPGHPSLAGDASVQGVYHDSNEDITLHIHTAVPAALRAAGNPSPLWGGVIAYKFGPGRRLEMTNSIPFEHGVPTQGITSLTKTIAGSKITYREAGNLADAAGDATGTVSLLAEIVTGSGSITVTRYQIHLMMTRGGQNYTFTFRQIGSVRVR